MDHPVDQLLLQSMMLMASADGDVAPEEIKVIRGIYGTLPQFGASFAETINAVKAHFRFGVEPAVNDLRALRRHGLHRKCYVLAAEVAFAHEGLNAQEEKMLEFIGRVLQIEPSFAEATSAVLSAKYAA